MEIKQLPASEYKDYLYKAVYQTKKYYDVELLDNGFQLVLKEREDSLKKEFSDTLFSEWLEEPIAYGAFEGDKLLGFVEGSKEEWHNLFRISNIFVFEAYRGKGIGEKLLSYMVNLVKNEKKYRGIILETQTCNYAAISLYKKLGFKLSRIDICEYTNHDVENKEVRIDLILKL